MLPVRRTAGGICRELGMGIWQLTLTGAGPAQVLRWVLWRRELSIRPEHGEEQLQLRQARALSESTAQTQGGMPRQGVVQGGRPGMEANLPVGWTARGLLPLLTALGTKETAFYRGILSLAHAVPVSVYVGSLPSSQGCIS